MSPHGCEARTRHAEAPSVKRLVIPPHGVQNTGEPTGEWYDGNALTAAVRDADGPGAQRSRVLLLGAQDSPTGLDEQSAYARDAGFGDRPDVTFVARAELGRDQTQKRFELVR